MNEQFLKQLIFVFKDVYIFSFDILKYYSKNMTGEISI